MGDSHSLTLMNYNRELHFAKLYVELHKTALNHEQMEILTSDFSLSLDNWMTLSKSFKLSIPLSGNIHGILVKPQKYYEYTTVSIVGMHFDFSKKKIVYKKNTI